MRCQSCQTDNSAGAKFCNQCGTSIRVNQSFDDDAGGRTVRRQLLAAERRNITVLFCDLVASTQLSELLDPEEWWDILLQYQSICANSVDPFNGYVAQYLGDGVLVYFGYPDAHEDNTRRAVMAGQEIIKSIAEFRFQGQHGEDASLAVRIGIHSGLVVVGEIAAGNRSEFGAHGVTLNIAARIQDVAEGNAVLISEACYRQVQDHFKCESLGSRCLKGVREAMLLYRVLYDDRLQEPSEEKNRSAGNLPMVGRKLEISTLKRVWASVCKGNPRTVAIKAEAGMGKSRLIHALIQDVEVQTKGLVFKIQCSPYHRNSVYYPVVNLLERRLLGFKVGFSSDRKYHQIARFLKLNGFTRPETTPLLGYLLGLDPDPANRSLKWSPELLKQKGLELLCEIFIQQSMQQPMLLVFEDLHWVDPSTLELIQLLTVRAGLQKILLVCSFRPEFNAPKPLVFGQMMELNKLRPGAVQRIVASVACNKNLPDALVEDILRKTDGIPLFVEELTKAALESSQVVEKHDRYEFDGHALSLEIPATLSGALMARFDRLCSVRSIPQLCAILGREFSFTMLKAISTDPEPLLESNLQLLVDGGLLYRTGSYDDETYAFKHALIQDAVYQSVLKRTRRVIHKKIADLLQRQKNGIVKSTPELIAHHYSCAGLHSKAIEYWLEASVLAIRNSANIEAIAHLRSGLQLINKMADPYASDKLELALLTALGPTLIASKGFAATEVGETYRRAAILCKRLDDNNQVFPTLWGLWVFYLVRSDLDKSRQYAEKMLAMANRGGSTEQQVEANWTLGDSLFWMGELDLSRKHLETAIKIYDPEKHHRNSFVYGQDPGVSGYCYLSYSYWFSGRIDQAQDAVDHALSLAERLEHPFSRGWALSFTGMLNVFNRDVGRVLSISDESIRFSTEQNLPFWLAASTIKKGWALAMHGKTGAGLALLREGMEGYRLTGSIVVQPFFMGLIAEAYGLASDLENALDTVEQAIEIARRHGERISMIELIRLNGKLLLQQSPQNRNAAESLFVSAIKLAQTAGAKMRELQVKMSYGQLLASGGRFEKAHTTLQQTYESFTEGFDTNVLREAKQLMDEWEGRIGLNSGRETKIH